MKKKRNVGTVLKSNGEIVEIGQINTPNTQKYTPPLIFLAFYRHFNKKWRV